MPLFVLLGGIWFFAAILTKAEAANIKLSSGHQINISGMAECGAFDDHALRATFGLEFQIFRCSKITLGFSGSYDNSKSGLWHYKIEFAPLYDSIKRKDNGDPIYYATSNAEGQSAYWDWYKNLGSRSYYLGDIPLIASYIERRSSSGSNYLRIGRQRNFIAFSENHTPWQDDGKFAPYADWLVRDLYTGIAYGYEGGLLEGNLAVFSGNNPIKGGGWYLNGVSSPNIKANNTGTYAVRLGLHPQNEKTDMQLYLGAEANILGSTWENDLGDGKRNNHRNVGAFRFSRKLTPQRQLGFLGQWTQYVSGLREESAQATNPDNNMPERFHNITQKGYFAGFYYQGKKMDYGYIYEKIDRFDYKIFAADNFTLLREDLIQRSRIYYSRIKLTQKFSIGLAWHNISNPAPEVSEIVTEYGGSPIDYETRFKIVTQLAF